MEKDLLTPEQIADRWNVTLITLRQWRWNGKGPRFLKIGRQIFYRPHDIESFEEKKAKNSPSYMNEDNFFKVVINNKIKERKLKRI